MLRLFLIFTLLQASVVVPTLGQTHVTLWGPPTIPTNVGVTYQPIFWEDAYEVPIPPGGSEYWFAYGGTISHSSATECSVTWTEVGTRQLYYEYQTFDNTYYAHLSVNVTQQCVASAPVLSFSKSSNLCSPRQVSYTGTPPSGVTWYWQTSAGGQSTANPSNTFNATTTGTYYVRAYNPTSPGCWSQPVSVYVEVDNPHTPGAIVNVTANTCGPQTLTIQEGIPEPGVEWYWIEDINNPQEIYDARSSFTTYKTGIVYLGAVSSSGCWNSLFLSTYVSVSNPPVPNIPVTSANACGPQTLSKVGTPGVNVSWFWQGTNSNGQDYTSASATGATYTVNASGQYFLRARNSNGCWSFSSARIGVTVDNGLPPPAVPVVSTNTCNSKTLSMNGSPPSDISWYWQGTDENGQDYTSATATAPAYTVSSDGITEHFIRARNSEGCWSPATGVEVTVDNPPAPEPNEYTFCDTDVMHITTTGGSIFNWYNTENVLLHTGDTYHVSLSAGNYTYRVKAVSAAGCEGASYSNVVVNVEANCDQYLNWTESIGYTVNQSGSTIESAASKSYFDGFGGLLQAQSKSYATNNVFASQPIKDTYNSSVITTLPAPINASTFGYRSKFVTNELNQPYSANDFDLRNTTEPGAITNPKPVSNGTIGTLGWYYSNNNTLESLTPTTGFPYSRNYTPEGPNPTTSTSAGPGDHYKMGSGHEVNSQHQTFTKSELSHYFSLKPYFIEPSLYENNLFPNPDANSLSGYTGNQSVSLTSLVQNGETYIRVISNQSYSTPGVVTGGSAIPVTPGATYKFEVKGYRVTMGSVILCVFNAANLSSAMARGDLLPQSAENEGWVQCTFTVPAGVTSLRAMVLFSGGTSVGESFFINAIRLSKIESDGNELIGYKFINTDPNGKKAVSFVDADGHTLASATLTGTSTYDNWNYTYYNAMGQVVATVAPNGITPGGSITKPEFVSYFKYDQLGRLIETTATDEGKSQFVYSTDGKIRFSQNQEQREAIPQRFSYTNYDYLGRLIESGEYSCTGTNPFVFEPHTVTAPAEYSVLSLVDNIGFTGVSRQVAGQEGIIQTYNFIQYDVQASDFPGSPSIMQTNLFGQVSRTENGNAITWYSYDEFGQLIQSWQKIVPMDNAIKTVEYTYDYAGNVTEVAYQKAQDDAFYHHYTYDADQRLTEVRTSTDGTAQVLQAKYYYYLHGPLKRVELGGNKQGIDYVYNIDGSLKAINHSDPGLDPGQDGLSGAHAGFLNDVFGEVLDYHMNDYIGADGSNEGNFNLSGYDNQFGGVVRAIRWHNHVDGHRPRAYAFKYDNLYQMKDADFGNITGSNRSYGYSGMPAYQESIGGYDKNGNIQSLVRKGKLGSNNANYVYNYQANTNKLSNVADNGSALLSYQYNKIGQMVRQTEGTGVMNVSYNAYGLVSDITNAADQLVTAYGYDDRGNRILKKRYENGTEHERIFQVYDVSGNVLATYVQSLPGGTITVAEVPVYGAGRIAVYKPNVTTTFYEISDHLGNVRGVIGSPETLTFTATLEDNGQANIQNPRVQELAYFKNLSVTAKRDDRMNHTAPSSAMPAPEYSSYLRWISGQSGTELTQSVGPAIGLKVEPGDKLDLATWVKYEKKPADSYTRPGIAGAMASILGSNFVGTAAGLDVLAQATQTFSNGLTVALSATVAGNGEDGNSLPYAYLYYLLYDRSFNLVTAGWKRVTTAGGFTAGSEALSSHEQLAIPTINITEPGYIYVFVANESEDTKVWFDDLKITQERSVVVAGADYYPFGLPMENREITREDYRYGYQGQYSEENDKTGWNEFELRMYDARIGRWLSVDPYGQFASPYVAMGNSPTLNTDPDGGLCCLEYAVTMAVQNAAAAATPTILQTVTITATRIATTRVLPALATASKVVSWYAKDMYRYATTAFVPELGGHFLGSTRIAAGINKGYTGGLSPDYSGGYDETGVLLGQGLSAMTSLYTMTPTPGGSPVFATPSGNVPVTQPVYMAPSSIHLEKVHSLSMGGTSTGDESKLTAQEIISKYRKGSIMREFPEELLGKTLNEILNLSRQSGEIGRKAKTALKLLKDGRFKK